MGNRYEVSGGVTKHTDLTDKEVNGVIDHANGSVTDAKLLSGVGLNDGQIAKLPTATQGQVLTRGASAWEAQAPSGGGFNSRISIYLSTSQSIPINAFTRVRFDTVKFDGNAEFDPTTNYRWTVKLAGYYLVSIRLKWVTNETAKPYYLYIYKSGSLIENTVNEFPYVGYAEEDLTTLLSLDANDYLEVYVMNGGTSSQSVQADVNGSHWYGHRLS
jgi:hypothetical protein